MSTSGITTLQLTRDQMITAAIRKLGRIAQGQTPSTEDITNGAQAFNTLIAQFRTLGMPLWTRTETTFSLTNGTLTYQIGIGKTINVAYPLKMLQAFRTDTTSTTRIPVEIVPRFNFNLYPTNSSGTPIQLTYQPYINYGEIKLWPTPDASAASGSTITVDYQAPFEYFNASTDTMGFPEEWYLPMIYGLAVLLAPEFGIPLSDRSSLSSEFKEYLGAVSGFGGEDGSMFFQPTKIG